MNKALKGFLGLLDRLDSLVKKMCTILTGLMVAVVVAQVFFRYVLAAPLVWTEELSRYLLIWSAFLGASSLIKTKENMNVDFFLEKFPKPLRLVIKTGTAICVFIFLCVVFYYSLKVYPKVSMRQFTPALQIRMFYVQLSVIIGTALMMLQMLNAFLSDFFRGDDTNV